jgi:DNA ligase-associated metallophosphoesterase
MQAPVSFKIRHQQFWLSPQRAIFWEQKRALIISDLHFGKTGHFRKAGIAVPQSIYQEDLQRLVTQIQYFQPDNLIIVGDFFHSAVNKEIEFFIRWRNSFPDLKFRLIKGNHDILERSWYQECEMELSEDQIEIGGFCFIHDISECEENPVNYYFSGHIHPGVRLNGMARQSLAFPCFYFRKDYAILPAFSRFTGLAMIEPETDEQVFAIVQDRVVQLQ